MSSFITPTGISEIIHVPSPGDVLTSPFDLTTLYQITTEDLQQNALPVISISPNVVNVDDTITYTFPTLGTNTMLGRQISGFWTKSESSEPEKYITDAVFFDRKEEAGVAFKLSNEIFYEIGDGSGPGFVEPEPLETTLSFVDDTISTTTAERETPTIRRMGSNLGNSTDAGFSSRDWKPISHEITWGGDSSVNYGPWNFSCADLSSAEFYARTANFGVQFQHPSDTSDDPVKFTLINEPGFPGQDESLLVETEIETGRGRNSWSSFQLTFLRSNV